MWELQGERLIGAAGCVAGAQRCFEQTLEYANERTAFGRPIGNFQVIRHKFAEMATKIESARQMVYTTAWRHQNGEYPVREISMAKLHASRIAGRGRRRVHPDPRRRRLHEGVRRRARLARHAPEPHRRRHRRDHARRDRPVVLGSEPSVGALADHVRSYYESLNTADAGAVARTSPTTPCTTTRAASRTWARGRSPRTRPSPSSTSTRAGRSSTPSRAPARSRSSGRWPSTTRAAGERCLDRGAEFLAFRDGLICEVRAYYDERGGDLRGFDHAGRGCDTTL